MPTTVIVTGKLLGSHVNRIMTKSRKNVRKLPKSPAETYISAIFHVYFPIWSVVVSDNLSNARPYQGCDVLQRGGVLDALAIPSRVFSKRTLHMYKLRGKHGWHSAQCPFVLFSCTFVTCPLNERPLFQRPSISATVTRGREEGSGKNDHDTMCPFTLAFLA